MGIPKSAPGFVAPHDGTRHDSRIAPMSGTESARIRRARLDAEGKSIQCGGKRDDPSTKRCRVGNAGCALAASPDHDRPQPFRHILNIPVGGNRLQRGCDSRSRLPRMPANEVPGVA